MARYSAVAPASETNRLDRTLNAHNLLNYAQMFSEFIIAKLMRAGFSRRKVRVLTCMAARLFALTPDGIDGTIQQEADQLLHEAGVRW